MRVSNSFRFWPLSVSRDRTATIAVGERTEAKLMRCKTKQSNFEHAAHEFIAPLAQHGSKTLNAGERDKPKYCAGICIRRISCATHAHSPLAVAADTSKFEMN